MKGWVVPVAALLLAGCEAPGNPPLVSAQMPPNVNDGAGPQPRGSLPPGAAGRPAGGPLATHPNWLSLTFGGR